MARQVNQITLTSKKNWWLVHAGDDEDETLEPQRIGTSNSFSSADTAVSIPDANAQEASYYHPATSSHLYRSPAAPSVLDSPQLFSIPRHPSSIFSFPTPTTYAAPPDPTANITPVAQGSASELFKCIVKKPEVVQLEINGEMQSNATDVTTQFLAELRVYTTLSRHRNIAAFLGCLEGLGLVIEFIDGHTLYDAIRDTPLPLTPERKVDYHNQLLSGLCHLHSFGLSHGDLSLLNIHISAQNDTIKLLDFGRSVSASSMLIAPDAEPVDPFARLQDTLNASLAQTRGRNAFARSTSTDTKRMSETGRADPGPKVEQIHPGTRPFSAPEILRGECADPLLADAYSFGMILVCLDREEMVDVKPWNQRKDLLPNGFFDKCVLFGERAQQYLRRYDSRRRLVGGDQMKL